jgi:hypothetical protein
VQERAQTVEERPKTRRCKSASVNWFAWFCPAPSGGGGAKASVASRAQPPPEGGCLRQNWSRAGRDGFLLGCRQTLTHENQNDPPNAS